MLARIPRNHRIVVWVVGLLSCAGMGAWLALATPVPLVWSSGALVGAGLGVLLTVFFLHLLDAPVVSRPASRPSTRGR